MNVGEPYQPADRRPMAARNFPLFERIARGLARRGVTANAVSIAGLVFGIAAGAALAATGHFTEQQRMFWIVGAALVQLRLMMNMFDGMVAIESGAASRLGELYNEIPDRISDAATLIGLGYAAGGCVTLGYLAACLAIFVAYIRAMGKVAGAHQEFCGPMAKPVRMFIVTLAAVYCGMAPGDWQPRPLEGHSWNISTAALVIIIVGCAITAVRRLTRIAKALSEGVT